MTSTATGLWEPLFNCISPANKRCGRAGSKRARKKWTVSLSRLSNEIKFHGEIGTHSRVCVSKNPNWTRNRPVGSSRHTKADNRMKMEKKKKKKKEITTSVFCSCCFFCFFCLFFFFWILQLQINRRRWWKFLRRERKRRYVHHLLFPIWFSEKSGATKRRQTRS